VRSGRPVAAATTSRPIPARMKRIPAPKNGAMSSNPTAITTHVLDHTSTQAAYRIHTSERGTGREGMTPRDEDRADDRGPGGRDLGRLGRAGRRLRALR